MKSIAFIICIIACSLTACNQGTDSYKEENFIVKGDTLPYRILLPKGYDPLKKYPVLFVLHGSGERGNDNESQLANGADLFVEQNVRKDYPAIVIFPQCASDSYWSNVNTVTDDAGKRQFNFQQDAEPTKAMKLLMLLVDHTLKRKDIVKKQIYIGGLSMGAMGTFEVLRRKPNTFAAAFAICGGDNPENTVAYQHVPLWIFHGEKDDAVDPEYSRIIINSLKEKGVTPKYTFYPEANHNSWDSAFAEPDLLPWLFSNIKK